MKTFSKYINEDVDVYRLNEVKAVYDVDPQEMIIQAPETYQENDVHQYIDDKYLQELPSFTDYAEKLFGKNCDNISDAYFEYDTFEHLSVEPKDYIEFETKLDSKNTSEDVKLDYFKLTNVRYIILFDRFDLIDVDDDTVKEKLVDIFVAAESNNENEWPIEIKFDEDNLEFRK